ncbi:DUF6443 domain-containing protein [Spongiimicrobium salis]|uniref:DUF6443 domain-containing protein n=1 Tax=Spongiimicrobium salis TaxID=1667022 RepID=UPI00374D964F
MKNIHTINAMQKLVLTLLLGIFYCATSYGQSYIVSGPTTVQVGDTETYTLSSPSIIDTNWSLTNATLISSTLNTAIVRFDNAGAAEVRANSVNSSFQSFSFTLAVTVQDGRPATPATPFITSSNCGETTLGRNGNPPSGVIWYWQGTNANGTRTDLGSGTAFKVSSTGTYYIRARNSSGQWSAASASIAVTTIDQLLPGSIAGVQTVCEGGNPAGLSSTALPSEGNGSYTYQWQFSNNGSTGWTNISGATVSTYNPPGGLTTSRWYRRAVTSCGNQTVVSNSIKVTVTPLPSTPPLPSIQNSCGSVTLTRGTPPSGIGWFWQTSPIGTSSASVNAATSIQLTTGTTHYLRPRTTNGCWGTAVRIDYTIDNGQIWYADTDGDGLGDPNDPSAPSCTAPAGFVGNSDDQCPTISSPTNNCGSAPPSAPSNLSASNTTSTTVVLSWTASTDDNGVTGYEVYQNGQRIQTVTTTSTTVTGLTPNTPYPFYVRAIDADANTSPSSNTINVITLNSNSGNYGTYQLLNAADGSVLQTVSGGETITLPAAAISLVAQASPQPGSVRFIWNGNTQTESFAPYAIAGDTNGVTYNPWTPGLGTVSIEVRYYSAASGGGSRQGTDTIELTFVADTPPTAPSNLVASNISTSSVQLNWNASTDDNGVTGYQVFQNNTLVQTVTGTNTLINGLAADTNYSFYVLAQDGDNNLSSASNTVNVQTLAPQNTNYGIYRLLNANGGSEIQVISGGETIDFSLTGTTISLVAELRDNLTTGSVVFEYNGITQPETSAPYAIAGNSSETSYTVWSPELGPVAIEIRYYSGAGGTGTLTATDNLTLNFIQSTDCPNLISSFPYTEGFENTFGVWQQDTSDDFDWTLRTATTPSTGTGPTGAQEGSHYIYMEVSSPNYPTKNAILTSPCFDLRNKDTASLSYYYQMLGNAVGTINIEASTDNGASWANIWTQSGSQGADWIQHTVDLSSYVGNIVQLRFSGTSAASWQGDIAIDNLRLTAETTGQIGNQQPTLYQEVTLGDENYIFTRIPQKEMSTINANTLEYNEDVVESAMYLDGLGRPLQQVAIKSAPSVEDVLTHISYDQFGRSTQQYLPYKTNGVIGSLRTGDQDLATKQYYKTAYAEDFEGIATPDINPFSLTDLEASPLNRPFKQAAPGEDWKLGNNHEVRMEYGTNGTNEVRYFKVTFQNGDTELPQLVTQGHYAPSQLYKTITRDENWQVGQAFDKDHSTEEFTNKEGQVVLKRTYAENVPHDTYYVYDNFGQLSFVFSPKVDTSDGVSATELSELSYQYRYDYRNRLVEKKLPGKGWEYIVYDKADRVVMTQDPNLRAQGRYLSTKYDALGRPVYTAFTNSSFNRQDTQDFIIESTEFAISEQKLPNGQTNTVAGMDIEYTNTALPLVVNEILAVNYYDTYTFSKNGLHTPSGTVLTQQITPLTQGLATGSKIRVLETNQWITNLVGYDSKGRNIIATTKNDYLVATDIVESKLDFAGKILESRNTHTKDTNAPIVVKEYFTYDHATRLKEQLHQIGNEEIEVIAENTYDNLGLLINKSVGNTLNGNRLQDMNYAYNVRGWLRGINTADLTASNSAIDQLFAMGIHYNRSANGSDPLFNGNIASVEWRSKNTFNGRRYYRYTYDGMNRLKNAIDRSGRFNVGEYKPSQGGLSNPITYDKNGNILSLFRRGHVVENPVEGQSGHHSIMDNLTYTYDTGNKLLSVTDASNKDYGFVDGNTVGDDYAYDANGNMTLDRNKGITGISYNYLNLPTSVSVEGNENTGNIAYVYDATGVKLEKRVTEGTSVVSTEYCGNYIYKKMGANANATLEFFSHTEGYVEEDGIGSYGYIYQYKDYLGNIRLSYSDDNNDENITINEIREENNYYPFGLKHRGYNNNQTGRNHEYGFQGEEEAEELGKNTIDYKWRDYDPAIARFIKIDRFAEKYQSMTPYHFGANNPIFFKEIAGDSVQGTTRKDARRARKLIRRTFKGKEFRKLRRLFRTKGRNFREIDEGKFNEATQNLSNPAKVLAKGYKEAINSKSKVHEVQVRKLNEKVTIEGKNVNASLLASVGGGNGETATGTFTFVIIGKSVPAPPDILDNSTGKPATNRQRNPSRTMAHELLGHGLLRPIGGSNAILHKVLPVQVDNLFLRVQNNGSRRIYRDGGSHGRIKGRIPYSVLFNVPVHLQ